MGEPLGNARLRFITGSGDGGANGPAASVALCDRILMASRRTSERELGSGSFCVNGDDKNLRQRLNVRLSTCCLIYRRGICAVSTATALVVVIVAAIEGTLKGSRETPYAESSPSWVASSPPPARPTSPAP